MTATAALSPQANGCFRLPDLNLKAAFRRFQWPHQISAPWLDPCHTTVAYHAAAVTAAAVAKIGLA